MTKSSTEKPDHLERGGVDPCLKCLALLAQFHQVAADAAQLQHLYGRSDGVDCDQNDVLRAAKALGLRARVCRCTVEELAQTPLPLIAFDSEGSPLIVARFKLSESEEIEHALIQEPDKSAPETISKEELDKRFSGSVILLTKRPVLRDVLQQKFDIRWFIPSLIKYKKHFGEVIVAAFVRQLFALVTPLFLITARKQQLQSELDHANAGLWRATVLLNAIEEPSGILQRLPEGLGVTQYLGKGVSALPKMAAAIDAGSHVNSNIPQQLRIAAHSLASRQFDAFQSELATLSATRQERQAERLAAISEQTKWQLQLPLVTKRAESHRKLASASHVSQDNWDAVEQQRIDVAQNLEMAKNREQQLRASINSNDVSSARLFSAHRTSW